MSTKIRVVHYLNQFFAQIGGEDKADVGLAFKDGPAGPGRALQQALGDNGEVVATARRGLRIECQDRRPRRIWPVLGAVQLSDSEHVGQQLRAGRLFAEHDSDDQPQ